MPDLGQVAELRHGDQRLGAPPEGRHHALRQAAELHLDEAGVGHKVGRILGHGLAGPTRPGQEQGPGDTAPGHGTLTSRESRIGAIASSASLGTSSRSLVSSTSSRWRPGGTPRSGMVKRGVIST